MKSRKTQNKSYSHISTEIIPQIAPYETIFSLLKSSLWGEQNFPFTAAPDTDWDAVYTELCHQTVQNLPIDILTRENAPLRQKYLQSTTRAVSNWYTLMLEQQTLYQLFQAAGIPFVILKGAAADYYYPQPIYRCMGDIDLIVKPQDFDRAYQLMLNNSYIVVDTKSDRHIELYKNNTLFELHRCFSFLNNLECAQYLDNRIYSGIDQAKESSIEAFSFPTLPRLENGLVLLEHINQHLESGLGLRQIIDWMLYVDKELDNDFWNNEFMQCAQQIGMHTLAITVTKMCQIYLGLREEITWCKDADTALCDKLMEYLLKQGNFGRKLPKHSNTVIYTMNFAQNIPALFRRLQQRGCINWKALERHPWLKPFAWLYQICRYIYLALHREHPFRQLWLEVSQSRQQDSILKRLGATQRHKGVLTPKGMKFY